MNLKTVTYDADVYQLMPKVATDEMIHRALKQYAHGNVFHFYKAMLAAAPQPPELSPWLPIEVAPKDGTPFLVSGFNYGDDYGERWHDIGVTSKKGAVVSTINANNLAFATHWMSLPQPPESK